MKRNFRWMQSLICLLLVAAFLLGGMPIAQVKAAVAAAEDDFVPVLRFMVTSDVHIRNDTDKINGHEQLAKLYETVYDYAENDPVYDKLDAMFFIGDNTQTGSENQQTYFFNYLKEHTKEGTYALAAMGNHEFKATGQNYNDPISFWSTAAMRQRTPVLSWAAISSLSLHPTATIRQIICSSPRTSWIG